MSRTEVLPQAMPSLRDKQHMIQSQTLFRHYNVCYHTLTADVTQFSN